MSPLNADHGERAHQSDGRAAGQPLRISREFRHRLTDRPASPQRAAARTLDGVTVFEVPGSKSITARALFLAAAASGTSMLRKPLDSDDTAGFADGLAALGYRIERTPGLWRVEGRPQGPAVAQARVFCRDGATTARFLPALASAGHGVFHFDATSQMRRLPWVH